MGFLREATGFASHLVSSVLHFLKKGVTFIVNTVLSTQSVYIIIINNPWFVELYILPIWQSWSKFVAQKVQHRGVFASAWPRFSIRIHEGGGGGGKFASDAILIFFSLALMKWELSTCVKGGAL